MSRRTQNILFACAALVLGCVLYVCFRGSSYVAMLIQRILPAEQLCRFVQPYGNAFLSFYLPDLLWAFSFCCLLNSIYVPGMKGTVACGGAAFLAGAIWEIFQYTGLVTGTGDVLDMLAYLLAALLSTTINLGGKT